MSDVILKIIPTTPSYVPNILLENDCKVYLERLFEANQLEFLHSENVEFIDQGQNFERVFCDICNCEIDVEYWGEGMDDGHKSKFSDLTFVSPCCGNNTSLNTLRYQWPAGFARFSVQIMNPDAELSDEDLQELQIILKTSLKVIWAHY